MSPIRLRIYEKVHVCVCVYVCVHSVMSDSCNPVGCSLPGSVEFSRQEYWSGLPFLSPGDLPNARIEPVSPALAGRFFTTSAFWEEVGEPKVPMLFQVLHEYHLI